MPEISMSIRRKVQSNTNIFPVSQILTVLCTVGGLLYKYILHFRYITLFKVTEPDMGCQATLS